MDGLLTFIRVIFICRTVHAMICFNCDRLREGEYCNKTIACAPNQVCGITRYLYTNEGQTIYRQQSCIDLTVCKFLHSPVIGRRDLTKKHIDNKITLDFNCCDYLLCNHDKYKESNQTTTRQPPTLPTTQTLAPPQVPHCVDDPMMPCSNAEARKIICSDVLTRTRCPESCGLCNNVLQPVFTTIISSTGSSILSNGGVTGTTSPTLSSHLTSKPTIPVTSDIHHNTTTPRPTSHLTVISSTMMPYNTSTVSNATMISGMTTNLPPCVDDPNTPCNDSSVQRVICADLTLAASNCPVSCGICDIHHNTTRLPTSHLTVVSSTLPPDNTSTVSNTTMTSGMTTNLPCVDDPKTPCNDSSVQRVICADPTLAASNCPLSCGICDVHHNTTPHPTLHLTVISSTMPPDKSSAVSNTTMTSGMTTNLPCVDDPNTPCNDPSVQRVICADPALAANVHHNTPTSLPTLFLTMLRDNTSTVSNTTMTFGITTNLLPCVDDPNTPCNDSSVQRVICSDPAIAASNCPLSCGICGSPLPTSQNVSVTSKMTTINQCVDDPNVPCDDAQVKLVVCSDVDLAKNSCQKTCGICA